MFVQWTFLSLCVIYAVERQMLRKQNTSHCSSLFFFFLLQNSMVYFHSDFIDSLSCLEFSFFDDKYVEHLHVLFHTTKHNIFPLPYFCILIAPDNGDSGQCWCYAFN